AAASAALRRCPRPAGRPSASRSVPCGDLLLIAEMDLRRPEDLVVLVSLAGDEQAVAPAQTGKAFADRRAAVRRRDRRVGSRHAAPYVLENRVGILGPGVVAGDDHAIRQTFGDPAHE